MKPDTRNTDPFGALGTGFTLVEMTVVVGIIAVLAAVSLPLYDFFLSFGTISSAKTEITQHLRMVQTKSKNLENNSESGIFFEPTRYTLYLGNSYAARNPAFDHVFELDQELTISGMDEAHFAAKTGIPSPSGILTLTHTPTNESGSITINSEGLIY